MRLPEVQARGRSMAGYRMGFATAVVRRITNRTSQNETNGREAPVWEVVYDGPFRLGGANTGSSGTRTETIAGGVEVQTANRAGHFPADTSSLADGDLIDITSGENAGTVWRIIEAAGQDQATALRVPIVQADRPEEWT